MACVSPLHWRAWWICIIIRWIRKIVPSKSKVVSASATLRHLSSILHCALCGDIFFIYVFKCRWLHCLRCADVLETDSSIGCFRCRIAAVYNSRIWNKWSKSTIRLLRSKRLFFRFRPKSICLIYAIFRNVWPPVFIKDSRSHSSYAGT